MEFDMTLISELLEALALAVIPVVAYMFSTYLRKHAEIAVMRLDEGQRRNLLTIVEIAVFAAEQVFGDGFGAEKKEYALGIVQKWVDSTGLVIDVELIDAAIEEAVFKNFNFKEILIGEG